SQVVTSRQIMLDDLLRFGDLEGISSEPIQHIVKTRHATLAHVLGVAIERVSPIQNVDGSSPEHEVGNEYGTDKRAPYKARAKQPLHETPALGHAPLIVVDGQEELPAGTHREVDDVESSPHLSGVMQDSPGIDDVEGSKPTHELCVQNRTLADGPVLVVAIELLSQLLRTLYRGWIIVEGPDRASEPAGGQREQSTATTGVQEAQARQIIALEHLAEGLFRF